MNNRSVLLALLALVVLAALIFLTVKGNNDTETTLDSPPSPESAAADPPKAAIKRATPYMTSVDSAPCRKLSMAERESYERELAVWYGGLGDSNARTYWPYQSVNNADLASMVEQGDAEAMLQLGLNRLWQATRVTGNRWPHDDEGLLLNTLERSEVDREAFMEAEMLLDQAIERGLFLAGRELFDAYDNYTETLELFISPNDPLPRDEAVRALIVGRKMYMNMLAGAVVFDTDAELSPAGRARAEYTANVSYRGWELSRSRIGLPAHTAPVPDALKIVEADDRCRAEALQ